MRIAFTVYTRKGLALFTGRAEPDGSFGFAGLRPGDYLLHVGAPGFLPAVRSFFVSAGETTALEVVLEPGECGFPLQGRITAHGRPVTGAVVRVFDEEERPLGLALTDGEGRYLFPALPPGELFVVVSGPGLVARAFPVTLPMGGATPWEVEAETGPCHLLKRFTDFHGEPVIDAEFRIVEISSGRRLFTVLTNREGFFWIRAWSSSASSPPWRWF